MNKKLFFFLILLIYAGAIQAQLTTWSFRRCLDTALQRNISVNQSKWNNELNKVSLEQSKATRYPSFSASASEALSIGRNINPTTNAFVTDAYHSTSLGLSSGYTLFNGLQNANTIRQQQLNVRAGEYDIEKVKNDVTLNITTGYLQVLFAMEILTSAEKQEKATQAQVERTEKLVNAGKQPESDLLQINSQLASDKLAVINARNQLDMARVTLMQLMEIPIDPEFTVEVPMLDIADFTLPPYDENIYERSLASQPQITGARLKSDASEIALKVSEGARWPRINLGANLNTNYASSRTKGNNVNPEGYPFFEQIWDNIGQSVNMGLSIPIYSNRQIKSNIDRAKINLENTRLSEQNVRSVLRKNVEQTYVDARAAQKKYEAVRQQLAAMKASYDNAEKKFQVGVMNATDFLIQKSNYEQSESSLIQAKFDYIFRLKILDFYQGNGINL